MKIIYNQEQYCVRKCTKNVNSFANDCHIAVACSQGMQVMHCMTNKLLCDVLFFSIRLRNMFIAFLSKIFI